MRSILLISFLMFSVLNSTFAQGDYAAGIDFEYRITGPRTVEVSAFYYGECSTGAFPNWRNFYIRTPDSATFYDSWPRVFASSSQTLKGFEYQNSGEYSAGNLCDSAAPQSSCFSGPILDYTVRVYRANIQLPYWSDKWVISLNTEPVSASNTISNTRLGGELFIDFSRKNGKGPKWYMRDMNFFTADTIVKMNWGGYSSDSVVVEAAELYTATSQTGYSFPFSANSPMNHFGVYNVDPSGDLDFVPNGSQNSVVCFKVSEYDSFGNLIAYSTRTRLLNISSSNTSRNKFPIIDSSSSPMVEVSGKRTVFLPGGVNSFSLFIRNPSGAALDYWLSNYFTFPGFQDSLINIGGNQYRLDLTFPPDSIDSGFPLVVKLKSGQCPYPANLDEDLHIQRSSCSFSLDTLLICSSGELAPTLQGYQQYSWSPGLAVSDSTISQPIINRNFSGWLTQRTDVCLDSIYIDSSSGIELTVAQDTQACAFDTIQLSIQVLNTFPYTVSYFPSPDTIGVGLNGPMVFAGQSDLWVVEVTQTNGCSDKDSLRVTTPDFQIQLQTRADGCAPGPDGAIRASTTVDSVTYLWDDPLGQSTALATNLGPGTYSVLISDSGGCSDSAQAYVPLDSFSFSLEATTDSLCANSMLRLETISIYQNQLGGSIDGILSPTEVPGIEMDFYFPDTILPFSNNGQMGYPSIFSGRQEFSRVQLLYTKEEILGAGGGPGLIFEIGFVNENPTIVDPMFDFIEIFAANTADTALVNWQNDLHQVADIRNIEIDNDSGLITLPFDTGFVWNGNTNVIFDLHFKHTSDYQTFNGNFKFYQSSAVKHLYSNGNDPLVHDGLYPALPSNQQPQLFINRLVPIDSNKYNFMWGPNNWLVGGDIMKADFEPDSSGWVWLEISDSLGCIQRDSAFFDLIPDSTYVLSSSPCYDTSMLAQFSILPFDTGGKYRWFFSDSSTANAGTVFRNVKFTQMPGYSYRLDFELETCAGSLSGELSLDTSCVWPGDMNRDGLVNHFDAFTFAMYYSDTGQNRPIQGIDFFAHQATDWGNRIAGYADSKFADADGNGVVDSVDFNVIEKHYQRAHLKDYPIPEGPEPYLVAEYSRDTFYNDGFSKSISYRLYPGDTGIAEIHAIVVKSRLDPLAINTQFSYFDPYVWQGVFGDSRSNLNAIFTELAENTEADWALVPTEFTNRGDSGLVAWLRLDIDESFFDPWPQNPDTVYMLNFSPIYAFGIDTTGRQFPITVVNNEVPVLNQFVGIPDRNSTDFKIFPNPATESVTIELDQVGGELRLLDLSGAELINQSVQYTRIELDLSELPAGCYFLKHHSNQRTSVRKLIVR